MNTVHKPKATCKEMQDKLREIFDIGDEPIFIIRGKDLLSEPAIDHYLQLAINNGCSNAFTDRVNQHLQEFSDWQESNKDKTRLPD